jgi:hypothetical protein
MEVVGEGSVQAADLKSWWLLKAGGFEMMLHSNGWD